MLEQPALHAAARLDLLHHAHIYLLPEAGHTGHAGRVGILHRLLHLLRVGVDDKPGALGQAQYLPSLLKDVGEGQEVQHAVVLTHWHTLIVGLHSGVVLAAGQDDALRVARRTTGVEHVGNVVHRGLRLQGLHLRLPGQVLGLLQQVVEVHGHRVLLAQADAAVEDDDALQRVARGLHAARLVILLLLADEEDAYLRIVQHKLYLLLRRGGIERDGDGANAPGAEVAEKVLRRILRKNPHVILHLHAEVEQGVRHLLHRRRELVPRIRFPLSAAEVLVDEHFAVTVGLGLLVNKHGQMAVILHSYTIFLQK